jgi:hypothetical protein
MSDQYKLVAGGPFTDPVWRQFYSRAKSLSENPSTELSEADQPRSDHSSDDVQSGEHDDAQSGKLISQLPTDASIQSKDFSGPIGREWILPRRGTRKPGTCVS